MPAVVDLTGIPDDRARKEFRFLKVWVWFFRIEIEVWCHKRLAKEVP